MAEADADQNMERMVKRTALAAIASTIAMIIAAPAWAQDMPTINADGHLGKVAIDKDGRLHASVGLNLRNGDFSRGAYDDDAANLDRLPVHAALTLGWELSRNASGAPDLWIEASTSNGFHAPIALERTSPRIWYESNEHAALIYKPNEAVTTALAYVVKTSPNGVSPTTNELTAAVGYGADEGVGRLHPSTALTVHTRNGHGAYALFGIEPKFDLGSGEAPPTIGVPARFGVGFDDFYGSGTGTASYESVGIAYAQPVSIGAGHLNLRAQVLALIRDKTVRARGGADAEHATIVPLATLGATMSF